MDKNISFSEDYNDLVLFASKYIAKHKILCDPEDLVNNAYLKFFESGKNYLKGDIRKYIAGESYRELTHENSFISFNEDYKQRDKFRLEGDIVCNECRKPKNVNEFRVYKLTFSQIYVGKQCKECLNKKHAEWVSKNREAWNRYMAERRGSQPKRKAQPIHELWKKANNKYIEKQREQLTDVYIRSIIKRKIPNPTPQQIEEKRQELKNKRIMPHS